MLAKPPPRPRRPTNWGLRPPLSISLAGLEPSPLAPWAGGPRAAIEWAASAGFRYIQLDAAAPGVRPRDLDRSGRRDLAALLRRLHMGLSGLDLWVPPEHFLDPARVERATDAALGAVSMAGDLTRLADAMGNVVVSLSLPMDAPGLVVAALERQADQCGVDIADHTLRDEVPNAGGRCGVGVDPAACLLSGKDPAAAVARAGTEVRSARLSDATAAGRAAVGAAGARLDLLAYEAALSVSGYIRPVIADVRGVRDQLFAASRALSAWTPST
jgi:hypothetical protein